MYFGGLTHSRCPRGILVLLALFVGSMAILVGPGRACTDYENYQQWLATLEFDQGPQDVASNGDYAYMAVGGGLLQVMDLTTLGAPELVGEATFGSGGETTLGLEGDLLGATVSRADGEFGVYFIDVSDPFNPTEVGQALPGTRCRGVVIEDTLAYVTRWDAPQLDILSVADPANPVVLNSVTLSDLAYTGLIKNGNYIYLACLRNLVTVNVANPLTASVVDTDPMWYDDSAIDLAFEDGNIYVGVRFGTYLRLHRYRTGSNPANPYEDGYFFTEFPGNLYPRVAVASGVCYFGIAALGYGIQKIGVSGGGMQDLGIMPSPGGSVQNLTVCGSELFVCQSRGTGQGTIQIVSVSSPDPLEPISGVATPGDARSVVVSQAKDGLAFVADGAAGMHVVDISDPLNPVILQTVDTPGFAEAIALAGDVAFVADSEAGLHSIDVTDPVNTPPTILDTVDTPGVAVELVVQADHAFVADSGAGLRVISIANPADIFEVGANDTLSSAQGVDISGSYAYVADGIAGLKTLNVADPDNPWIVGGVKGRDITDARKVDLSFGKAFVVDAESGLVVVDVADPMTPITLSSTSTIAQATDVQVQGIFAYVGSGTHMQLIDVRDPGHPVNVGSVEVATLSRGLFADENYAYVAGGDALYICPTQCGFDERVYSSFAATPQAEFHPITVDFTNTSEGYGLSYVWDFGDGVGTSTEKDPTYSYPLPGDYPVTLIATNGTNTDSVTVVVSALSEKPVLTGIADVPADQGGFVHVNFYHCGYDDTQPNRSEMYSIQHLYGDTWVTIATVGAYGAHYYTALVSTVDNGPASALSYRVIAHMDEGIWISDPADGYSVDNIPPEAPVGVTWATETRLDWDPVNAADLDHYEVLGAARPTAEGAELLAATVASQADIAVDSHPWVFVVAVDHNGLRSEPSAALAVSAVPEVVSELVLGRAYPNPFNPHTSIDFAVPRAAHVRLAIYDLSGRLVRSLVDGVVPAGRHTAVWQGRGADGHAVASGTYFSRLEAEGKVLTGRLLLLK